MKNTAKVYLVGAGPGDLGLFTLRGLEVLRRAETVIYDGLIQPELLRFAPSAAELVYAGKHDRSRCTSQEEINALLLAKAREGRIVVRLKGGDPFLFGRGGEEAQCLADAGVDFEIVPGVSSIQAVPACAGIPLTDRRHSSSLAVVTGHIDPGSPESRIDWPLLARFNGTLAVLMGLKHLRAIASILAVNGRALTTPIAVVSHGTTSKQRTVVADLATIADAVDKAAIEPPAVIVIGAVVGLREKLDWFESRDFFGQRIVLTQRADLAQSSVKRFRELGADVLEIPATLWGEPDPENAAQEQVWSQLETYDWIVFSNGQAVDFFLQRFLAQRGDLRELGPVQLGAYGSQTGDALRRWHLRPSAVSADHKTPLILAALKEAGLTSGQKVLILRGDHAEEKVPEALRDLGVAVDVSAGYSVQPDVRASIVAARSLEEQGADWLVFASGMAIEHFHQRFDLPKFMARHPQTRIALGASTILWALDKLGLKPSAIGDNNQLESLIEAMKSAEA